MVQYISFLTSAFRPPSWASHRQPSPCLSPAQGPSFPYPCVCVPACEHKHLLGSACQHLCMHLQCRVPAAVVHGGLALQDGKWQFSTHDRAGVTPKIWRQSPLPLLSYKRTHIQTHEQNYILMLIYVINSAETWMCWAKTWILSSYKHFRCITTQPNQLLWWYNVTNNMNDMFTFPLL